MPPLNFLLVLTSPQRGSRTTPSLVGGLGLTDHIQMPDEGLFAGTATMTGTVGHYATLVHELVP